MKITFDYVRGANWLFDEDRGIGVEIQIKQRRFHNIVDIHTINSMQLSNRIETIIIPNLFRKYTMKPLIDRAFNKIKHRYEEWGLKDIKFPWKEVKP